MTAMRKRGKPLENKAKRFSTRHGKVAMEKKSEIGKNKQDKVSMKKKSEIGKNRFGELSLSGLGDFSEGAMLYNKTKARRRALMRQK